MIKPPFFDDMSKLYLGLIQLSNQAWWNLYNITYALLTLTHYENTPIQIYWKFYNQKRENLQIKNSDIFHIPAQNIDCGYSLELPHRGGSNEYPQPMFFNKIRKIMYTPVNPSFTI